MKLFSGQRIGPFLLLLVVSLGNASAPPEAACIRRELAVMSEHFDADLYKNEILAQAGTTQEDIVLAFVSSGRHGFVQTDTYQRVRESLDAHNDELEYVAQELYAACREEANSGGTTASGVGAALGALLSQAAEEGQPLASTNLTSTSSKQDSCFVDTGLHIEVGALVDFQIGFFSNGFQRYCFGAELGFGAEVSFVVTFGPLGRQNDCGNPGGLADIDAAVGPAIGFGVMVCPKATDTTQALVLFDLTLGVGAGFGLGAAVCAYDP